MQGTIIPNDYKLFSVIAAPGVQQAQDQGPRRRQARDPRAEEAALAADATAEQIPSEGTTGAREARGAEGPLAARGRTVESGERDPQREDARKDEGDAAIQETRLQEDAEQEVRYSMTLHFIALPAATSSWANTTKQHLY